MNVMVKLLTKREHLLPSINPVLIVGIRNCGQASPTSKILQAGDILLSASILYSGATPANDESHVGGMHQ